MTRANPLPEGMPAVVPLLVRRDAASEMDFCQKVFGAEERS